MEEKIYEMFIQIAKLPLLIESVSRFENCVQTLSQTVASYDAEITYIEKLLAVSQLASPPWRRMRLPSPADPARQALGTYLDIVMVPQPLGLLGPMPWENTRR